MSRSGINTLIRRVAALVMAVLATLATTSVPATADSPFPPGTGAFTLTVTVNGTTYTYAPTGTFPNSTGPTITGLSDGDQLTIAVDGGTSSKFSRLRARQCRPNQPVNNVTEFNPQITNYCSAATLGSGSPAAYVDSGPLPPGTGQVQIAFRVGVGTAPDVVSAVDDELIPGFTCDEANVCRLVINAEVTSGSGSSNLLSFPLQFGNPVTVPGKPSGVSAVAGSGSATVSWSPPASDGGAPITSYTVRSSLGSQTCTWTAGPLSCTVSGLTNGTAYTFTVRATNSVGDGPESDPSNPVTPQAPITGARFFPLDPVRIQDSRSGSQVGQYG
ncbi:fibronectin type III domain-containing protein, partial [Rhabdothermincola sp.]|uniref:fibronectin type III domain-containing protein n=1 Tax=Rhabdothermincola sp. TaxID=2820405 RepID=UPI002FDF9496